MRFYGVDARRGVTLVDTNVLLDLVTDDPRWAAWSVEQLEAAKDKPTLNPSPKRRGAPRLSRTNARSNTTQTRIRIPRAERWGLQLTLAPNILRRSDFQVDNTIQKQS
jgi:hypothetical protein